MIRVVCCVLFVVCFLMVDVLLFVDCCLLCVGGGSLCVIVVLCNCL